MGTRYHQSRGTSSIGSIHSLLSGSGPHETHLHAHSGYVVLRLLAGALLAKEATTSAVGKKVDEFSLQDFRGKSHALSDLQGSKLVVVAFLGVECPLSKLYAPRLVELAKQYEPQGVAFLGVDSNRQDSVTEMAQYAKLHGIEFPLLKDLNNSLADALGASRNPQVFLLDTEHVVRYLGRIDDQYGFETGSGYARPVATKRDLANALDELLAGKSVTQPTTEAIGCLIGRVRPADNSSDVTYSNQIAHPPEPLRRVSSPWTDWPVRSANVRRGRGLGRNDR